MVFSRCMHTSVSSDSSRGRRQTRVAIHVSITQTALRLRAGRHPARTGSVAEGPSLPSVLGKREEPVSEIRLLSLEGVGSVDHASEPFLVHGRNQSRVPSLRPAFTGHQRYYEPLAEFLATWPTGTPPLRDPLIGSAFARRGQPARVSPVPCRAVPACSPPYPGGVPRPSGASDAVCCLHREMTGSADLSLSGAYVSGLQGSLDAGPAGLLPARGHTASVGLSTLRFTGEISLDSGSLLPGAPALTRAGLTPASSTRRASRWAGAPHLGTSESLASGRTIDGDYTALLAPRTRTAALDSTPTFSRGEGR